MAHSSELLNAYGALIRSERLIKGWSQEDLAVRLQVSFVMVSSWERGKNLPTPYRRSRLDKLFNKNLMEVATAQAAQMQTHTAGGVQVLSQPSLYHIPYLRNLHFSGREDVLAQLYTTFFQTEGAAIRRCALSGLGGAGKTSIALEFAHRFLARYQMIFWVTADTLDQLISDCVTIVNLLHLPRATNKDIHCTQLVKQWLETHEKWLLILDGVEDLSVITPLIPVAGKGHVLFTTHSQALSFASHSIEIGQMPLEEGTSFLLHRADLLGFNAPLELVSSKNREAATKIVQIMGGLPLALDQAGAYISDTKCTLSNYLDLYHAHRRQLLQNRGTPSNDHPLPIASTWSLSFAKIEQSGPVAANILRIAAFLHPSAIPEECFIEGSTQPNPLLHPIASNMLELNQAMSDLRRFSFISRNPDTRSLSIHSLVLTMIVDRMTDLEQKDWAERAVRIISSLFPIVKFETWSICRRYLSQAQACATLIEQKNMQFLEAAYLLDNLGCYLMDCALYQKAEQLFILAQTIIESQLGINNPETARIVQHLAMLYLKQGRYEEAEPCYLSALTIRETTLDPLHLEIAETLNSIGVLYNQQGKYKDAQSFLHRAQDIREQLLDAQHPLIADSLHNLASLQQNLGNYGQAEQLYQSAIAICKQVFEVSHPAMLENLKNLARLYSDQGKYHQAELTHKQISTIIEQIYGPIHPEIALNLDNLALLSWRQGKYESGISFAQRSIAIYKQIQGPTHPDIASSVNGLAMHYWKLMRYVEAEKYFLQSLAIYHSSLRPDHPYVGVVMNNLALVYVDQGRYAEAESLYMSVLSIYQQAYQNLSHPDAALTFDNLAQLYWKQGKHEQSRRLFLQAIVLRRTILGHLHPDLAISLHGLALLYIDLKWSKRAKALLKQAKTICEISFPPDHPDYQQILKDYEMLLDKMRCI